MRVQRHAVPMTVLDLRCIVALEEVRGLSINAQRIHDGLKVVAQRRDPITVRQRHALYAICWRFRRQIPMRLQVKVTLALAEAKAAAEEIRMDQPVERQTVRGWRVVDGGKAAGPAMVNPLDDLFPETVPG
ncbi:MAG TPA: hypothetical protein VFB13_16200 [Reyranella sp.]|nr:hypothetical protein [Reyranella sp.]